MPATQGHGSAAHRTRLVGYHDLQGREALQVILQGDWCYVGHLPGMAVNPLTGQLESNGTSILDVSNPAQPRQVANITIDGKAQPPLDQFAVRPNLDEPRLLQNT